GGEVRRRALRVRAAEGEDAPQGQVGEGPQEGGGAGGGGSGRCGGGGPCGGPRRRPVASKRGGRSVVVVEDVGWIREVFASFQGEGTHVGRRTVFVRTAGCSLRCRFCDTPEALVRTPSADLERRAPPGSI